MTFHMPAGALNPDAPEVWGMPYRSPFSPLFLIGWYDANGNNPGVTVAKGAELEWITANPLEISRIQAEVGAWLKNL